MIERPRWPLVRAVLRREFRAYFQNPAGYVFITLFVFLGAVAAFWQESFFADNLADLHALNQFFPVLLVFFAPAVAMGAWASERARGTDEVLLTLPLTDAEALLGKYLAALGIYSVALLFSVSHLLILGMLGDPDWGLLFSNYLGFWFLGAALLSIALAGSLLTRNLTVAFILGALFCALPVFQEKAGVVLPAALARHLEAVSLTARFRDMAAGLVTLPALLLFAGVTGLGLYVNLALLGRRRAPDGSGFGLHRTVRALCVLIVFLALAAAAGRVPARIDLTAERLHTMSRGTRELVQALKAGRPVFIQAFISPRVPRDYVQTREDLLVLLRQLDLTGGDGVIVRVNETEPFSKEARRASEEFGIHPQAVSSTEPGQTDQPEIFLGVAMSCGNRETVLPFLHKGLPVEYELARNLRVVTSEGRRRVGLLATEAQLQGGFDPATFSPTPEWSIVRELKQQYDVEIVQPDRTYPDNLDVLVVAMPSSLSQAQLDILEQYILGGHPTLLLDDPLPLINPKLAPSEPGNASNPFSGEQVAKGNVAAFHAKLGVTFPVNDVVWDFHNPHPALATLPPEFVFVDASAPGAEHFHPTDPVTAGLQEVVLLAPGRLESSSVKGLTFTPLMNSSDQSGTLPMSDVMRMNMFGPAGWNEERRHDILAGNRVLAARIAGIPEGEPANDGKTHALNLITVADLDLISDQFFQLRREGVENLDFDNVGFILNAVDNLAGEASLMDLRRKRPRHRTLVAVEELTRRFREESRASTDAAEKQATERLAAAQKDLDAKVQAIRDRTDLDEQTKVIMLLSVQEVEQKRFAAEEARIEDDKKRALEEARSRMEIAVRGIQQWMKALAALIPPVPAFLLAAWVFLRRLRAEREAVPDARRVGAAS